MFKRVLKSELALSFLGGLAARYIRFVRASSRVVREPADLDQKVAALQPVIYAMWHGQFLMIPSVKPSSVPVRSMVARHGDAELMGRALAHFNTELIRGAGAGRKRKDKGGGRALRAALHSLREGVSVAMTADVPPGPARAAGLGIVTLAKMSGRPVVPSAVASSRFVALNTWSRFTINLPFSRIACVVGEPIYVPEDASDEALEAARVRVEEAMNDVTRRAYAIAGADPARAAPPLPKKQAPGLLLKVYRGASRLARPAMGPMLHFRRRRGKEDGQRLGERFGQAGVPRPEGILWWFHAASVGETNAILPVLYGLRETRPDLKLLLTTFTVTSAQIAALRLPEGAVHQFAPLDSPHYVKRFLDYWRPDMALFTESEIWPNLIMESDARDIPLALLNARMSPRSFDRWRRRSSLSRPLFSAFDVTLAQDKQFARQLERLGARRVMAAGNIKFDAPPPPVDAGELARLKAAAGGRPAFLAASTHPGEDEIVVQAHMRLLERIPDLLTIIAPRHPQRGEALCAMLAESGVAASRRSLGELPSPETGVYVADTLGELGLCYAMAPLAFIGGSFIPQGGHNPIEAVQLGSAVLTGPHWHNFRETYEALAKRGGCRMVMDGDDLTAALAELYSDPDALQAMRHEAMATVTELGGALKRTLDALTPYLPETAEDTAARSRTPAHVT
jgi:3-deoxy-D-manno-octulosonic-acid transferase